MELSLPEDTRLDLLGMVVLNLRPRPVMSSFMDFKVASVTSLKAWLGGLRPLLVNIVNSTHHAHTYIYIHIISLFVYSKGFTYIYAYKALIYVYI